jgi:hypothetical protein
MFPAKKGQAIYRVFIYIFSAQLTACLRDLARHFKTDPTETVLGIPENTRAVS